jgi:hypothetical protein
MPSVERVAFLVFSRLGVALECNRKPYPCIIRTPLCESKSG